MDDDEEPDENKDRIELAYLKPVGARQSEIQLYLTNNNTLEEMHGQEDLKQEKSLHPTDGVNSLKVKYITVRAENGTTSTLKKIKL